MYTLAVGTLGCIADVKCCLVNKVLSVDYRSLHALQCWLGNKVLSVDYHNLVFFKSLIIACTSVLAG